KIYDYSGYGQSTGKASECNTYADVDAVYKCLKEKYSVKDDQLILYGQSVGSGPTIDLASRTSDLRGVVLHSPILSGMRVLYPVKRTYWFDIYKFVLALGKSKTTSNGSKISTADGEKQKKASESGTAGTTDTIESRPDLPEVSRNSLDSRLDKSKKPNKPEKSRMSVDLFRKRKALVW
nr:hypothetical protein [Tanacetum cinerariifolium]